MSKEDMIKDLEGLVKKWVRIANAMNGASNMKEFSILVMCSEDLIEINAKHKFPNYEKEV